MVSQGEPLCSLQECSLESLREIRDEINFLFQTYCTEPSRADQTLKNLFSFMFSRSQVVSLLVSWGYSWDAEILLRSFYEAAAKILFIASADEKEKTILVEEFWDGLGPINDRRNAQKASHAERVFKQGSVSAQIFTALQNKQIFDLNPAGNRSARKKIEKKWSFSEIIGSLHERSINGKSLIGIKSLLHVYGMASHLTHADQAAMELMADRVLRESEERKLLEAGHASRIMTDQVSITWLCADALRIHCKGFFQDTEKMRDAFERPHRLSRPIQSAFEKSQQDFYDRWLGPKT